MKKSYEQWESEVNKEVEKLCGLSKDDLPDYQYYDAYQDKKTPKQTARKAIAAAKKEYGY